jgi:hypothetical protein
METTVGFVVRVAHHLAEPLPHLPAWRPGSIRRTSSVDMVGSIGGALELIGLAHDPRHGAASCHATLGPDRTLVSAVLTPALPAPGIEPLLGRVVGRGFRAAVDELCEPETLLSVLLHELPVAALLSGYGSLYTGRMPAPLSQTFIEGMPVDICAGWISDGTMMRITRSDKMVPTPDGPPAAGSDIDEGWHPLPRLEPGTMRRQRLIERTGGDVWAMFRDTYARLDGQVIVLHEYTATATLEPIVGDSPGPHSRGRSRVLSCEATPRVLPWLECPAAASSATRIEGRPVADLRALVKDEFVGISTCTHLNDLLASLAQADALV